MTILSLIVDQFSMLLKPLLVVVVGYFNSPNELECVQWVLSIKLNFVIGV
jgi:hypothetical protein